MLVKKEINEMSRNMKWFVLEVTFKGRILLRTHLISSGLGLITSEKKLKIQQNKDTGHHELVSVEGTKKTSQKNLTGEKETNPFQIQIKKQKTFKLKFSRETLLGFSTIRFHKFLFGLKMARH